MHDDVAESQRCGMVALLRLGAVFFAFADLLPRQIFRQLQGAFYVPDGSVLAGLSAFQRVE
jgi:hypothetical protein